MDEYSKQGFLFGEALMDSVLGDTVVIAASGWDDLSRLLEVEVSVSDLSNWSVRYEVLRVAADFEEAEDLQIRCFFRASSTVDPALASC